MYWIKDFESVNGSWVWRETWGQSGWRTDATLSPWFNWANDNRTRSSLTTVQFKHRYYESTPTSAYYWCSSIYEHYLWNNTSAEIGTGVCSS